MTRVHPHHMLEEIHEQPAVVARVLGTAADVTELCKLLRQRPPKGMLFVARGTSDHAALYGKYLVEAYLACR